MSEPAAVEIESLTKRYGSVLAVDDLSLTLQSGEVYGFLGPNGAGKTTTLRMLLGLIKPTSGKATVLGGDPGEPAVLARTGALVETPGFYPYLSGRDNLVVTARLSGVRGAERRVGVVLELVGLSGRAGDKFKVYSTGMKQRLGVAAALLKDPDLLILDEPTNGLDPSGVAEMRNLIRALGTEKTVLFSSHQLGEVEQVCDRVGVIRNGKLIAEGTLDELQAWKGILLRAEPTERAAEVARGLPGVEAVEVREDGAIVLRADPERSLEISHKLFTAGVRVGELRPERRTLEEVFFELTDGEEE